MNKTIKIQRFFRPCGMYGGKMKIVPKISLSGNWMNKAGFKPSDFVNVECENKRIILTLIE
jgi:hypothetical protein